MMNNTHSHEISFLIEEVAKRYGGRLKTTTDFDALEAAIGETLGETVSSSSLKRLWGYVSLQPKQRRSTLDILARYAGRDSYQALCKELLETSDFFSTQTVQSTELAPDQHLQLCWMPDRTVVLRSLGGQRFEVEEAGTSKLRAGDIVEATEFIQGQPLYMAVTREGEKPRPYVAGRAKGLTHIEVY